MAGKDGELIAPGLTNGNINLFHPGWTEEANERLESDDTVTPIFALFPFIIIITIIIVIIKLGFFRFHMRMLNANMQVFRLVFSTQRATEKKNASETTKGYFIYYKCISCCHLEFKLIFFSFNGTDK